MNIVYFGSDVFVDCFRALIAGGHRILALYTYHEDGEYINEDEIVACAAKNDIPVRYDRMRPELARELFYENACDLFFSAEYDRKIPVPESARFRGLNIHNSLLPEGRGYFPIEMRLYYGYDYGGVTMHKLSPQIDQGDILLQRRFSIAPSDDDRALYRRCQQLAVEMTREFMADSDGCWQRAVRQRGGGSYWPKPTAAEFTITPQMTVERIAHTYRAMGRFTRLLLDGREYKVERLYCTTGGAGKAGDILNRNVHMVQFRAQGGVVTVEFP